jgi:hypothetical protein
VVLLVLALLVHPMVLVVLLVLVVPVSPLGPCGKFNVYEFVVWVPIEPKLEKIAVQTILQFVIIFIMADFATGFFLNL